MAKNDGYDMIRSLMEEADKLGRASIEDLHKQALRTRIKELKEEGKTEKEIKTQLEKDQAALREKNLLEYQRQELKSIQDRAKAAATLEEQNRLEADARRLEQVIKRAEIEKANEEKLAAIREKYTVNLKNITEAGSRIYDDINKSVKTYSDYFDEIQVRLLGSGKTYTSVADMISKTFSGSPFFALTDAMNNVKAFVQQGIAYNVELRATLQTVSEKIAITFNALDATLLRLIRIQGDSTQARLGIESKLTKILNSQFQDTSYLTSNINESVSAALLEAETRLGRTAGTEFEFEAQKWLGSLYASGASQNLISSLAQGLGYLGSGDVTSLTSNASLTNLLAMAAGRGGGASYGDIITRGATAGDVSSLMIGLRSLVEEVSKTDNIVALKEYANVFGLTISDLKSILNLTSKDIETLTKQTLSYDEALQTVNSQLTAGTLLGRTHVSELIDNIYQNTIDAIAAGISGNVGGYLGWKAAGFAGELLEGYTMSMAPFGIGTTIDLGKTVKTAATATAALANINKLFSGLGNLGGINLANLEGTEVVQRGTISNIREGTRESYSAYEGDVSQSTLLKQSSLQATEASKVTDEALDEKQEALEGMQNQIKNIDDNISIMVRLLDSEGIVIRGRAGEVASSYANQLAGIGGIFQG